MRLRSCISAAPRSLCLGLCCLWLTAGSGCAYWRQCFVKSGHAQALYCRALEHGKQGDPNAAVECLREALAANPHDVDARWELAKQLIEAGQTDAAITELTYLVEHHPDDSRAFVQLAQMLHERGRLKVAEQLIELALRVDGHCEEALLLRGRIAEQQQEWDAALETYHQLLTLQPQHVTARLQIAAVYEARQEPETAAALLRETLQKTSLTTPQQAHVHGRLGRLYADLNRWPEAVHELALAGPERATDPALQYELAYARFRMGDVANCQADLAQLLSRVPDHPAGRQLQRACGLSVSPESMLAGAPPTTPRSPYQQTGFTPEADPAQLTNPAGQLGFEAEE